MKIALVHELLTMRGGAERVLRILADHFPDAPIYTLLYDEAKLGDWFPRSRIRTSLVQRIASRFPLPASVSFNHHLYLKHFPRAVEAWDFSEYDLVLSLSSAFVHGIITNSAPKHICYVNSPARYLWDRTHDVLERASGSPLGAVKRWHLEKTFHPLRIWDTEAADRPDVLLAASKIVQRRIELYWRRESSVLYPPIDDFWLNAEAGSGKREAGRNYFLIVSTLVPYKNIDIAIHAANARNAPLKIVGEGPDKKRLQGIAGPTVEFCGYRSREEVRDFYANARATIFPGDEDFGLVPIESMACGTPVIALRSGGALETILEGETGEFFDKQTSDSLQSAMQKLEQKKYSKDCCNAQAKNFSTKQFLEGIDSAIQTLGLN
jgi:glycosyltransferase involved in cell wall biosynthesis